MDNPQQAKSIDKYLGELARSSQPLSEPHLYSLIGEHLVKGLWGYSAGEYEITPLKKSRPKGPGVPDLRLKSKGNDWWVVGEAKTDDQQIRDTKKRQELWAGSENKQKYVTGDTVYFVWFAPRTILICDPTGKVIRGVYLESERQTTLFDLPGENLLVSTESEKVAEHLSIISADETRQEAILEKFSRGETPYGYIPVNTERLDELAKTLSASLDILLPVLENEWQRLHSEYAEFKREYAEVENRLLFEAWRVEKKKSARFEQRQAATLRAVRKKHRRAIELIEEDFPSFRAEQSYTSFEKGNQAEEQAIAHIFRISAAYVILGRLLFVRLAEDAGMINPKISNGGLKVWEKLLSHPEKRTLDIIRFTFGDAKALFEQLFAPTPFDSLIPQDNEPFGRVLLRILYRLNAFDFKSIDVDILGGIYQNILPREKRKALGEFYTDVEVVDHLLHRTGFVEALKTGEAALLLDPACGSGTFLVRAAHLIRKQAEAQGLPPELVLEKIERLLHGLDINHFAVYIAEINLLFAVFDLLVKAQKQAKFHVHQANSILRDDAQVSFAENGNNGLLVSQPIRVRDRKYDFVFGNPPYVRNERLPEHDRDALEDQYADVRQKNADLSVFFLRRAVDWLEDGGRFGMIVPRALSDSAYAEKLRDFLLESVTIEELVPLDWTAHELFDCDVVPMLLIFKKEKPDANKHMIRLIQRINNRGLLLQAALDEIIRVKHISEIPLSDFQTLAQQVWPIELTPRDVPVLKKLSKYERLGNTEEPLLVPRYGIKAGAKGSVVEVPKKGFLPMLTGSDISSFGVESPARFVDLSSVEDRSIWGKASDDSREVIAIPVIYVTLAAAVIETERLTCQDSIIIGVPSAEVSAYSLAAVINSTVNRYFAFLLLRSGVTGGGRRDAHNYPRVIAALPKPNLNKKQREALDSLSRDAHETGAIAAADVLEIWKQLAVPGKKKQLSDWPLDFNGWSADAKLRRENWNRFEQKIEHDEGVTRLLIADHISIAGPEPLLRYVELLFEATMAETEQLTKTETLSLSACDKGTATRVLSSYESRLAEQEKAETRFYEILGEIDKIVMDGFGLTVRERKIIQERMNEFPLKETAARIRSPWEKTRRPKIKQFVVGKRYKS